MKTVIYVLSILLFLASFSQAETSRVYRRYEQKLNFEHGKVYLTDGRIIEGVLRTTKSWLSDGDIKVVSKDGEIHKLYTVQTKGYEVGNETYHTFNDAFYKLEVDGKMRLYSKTLYNTYSAPGANGMMMTYSSAYTGYYIMQEKELSPRFVPSGKRKFREFIYSLRGCRQVREQVQEGLYKHGDIVDLVKKFNDCEIDG